MENFQLEEPLIQSFDFFRFLNNLSGAYQFYLNQLDYYSRNWVPGQTITILDLYCGRGDLSREVLAWSKKRKVDVQILGVDSERRYIELARNHSVVKSSLVFDARNWDDPSFLQAQQFDYVFSHSSLYRMPRNQAVQFLKKANLLAKRGIIISDWSRNVQCSMMMKVFSLFWKKAAVSGEMESVVKNIYSFDEAKKIMKEADIEYSELKRIFGVQFAIFGERRLAMSAELKSLPGLAQA